MTTPAPRPRKRGRSSPLAAPTAALLGLWTIASGLGSGGGVSAQAPPASSSSDAQGDATLPAFIALHYDEGDQRVLLEASDQTGPVLHVATLANQIDWPLDRGTVRFDRSPAILTFRGTGEILEVRSLDPLSGEATVTLLPIVETGDGTWIADATEFLVQDAFGVAESLLWVGETGELDKEGSSVIWATSEQGPSYAHVDVRTTFRVPGGTSWVEDRTPDPETLAVLQRHVFFQTAPDFVPVPTDGRVGINGMPFVELSESDRPGNWVPRWRALTAGPAADRPEPLRVYLDPAIPDSHHGALHRAVNYWNRALRAIGGGGKMELLPLPPDADPLSLRYPVVFLWMERPQPMSSMANIIADPRSGEGVKGIIQLAGHVPAIAANEYRAYRPALSSEMPSEEAYVADRMAWVAAHELGHLIGGLAHTASKPTAVGFRMPWLSPGFEEVDMDLSGTLPDRPFEYDLWTLAYAYPEAVELTSTDLHGRMLAGGEAHFWPVPGDLGQFLPNAVTRVPDGDYIGTLNRARQVRAILLNQFDGRVLSPGEPEERIFERLFPVYFHHRFALDAVCRMVAGVGRVPGSPEFQRLPAETQWSALDAIVGALAPEELIIPQSVTNLIPPSASDGPGLVVRGDPPDPSMYWYQTGNSSPIEVPGVPSTGFDGTGWAESVTLTALRRLLTPDRLARLAEQHDEDPAYPGVEEVLGRLVDGFWSGPPEDQSLVPYDLVRKRVLREVITSLLEVEDLEDGVRASIVTQLEALGP